MVKTYIYIKARGFFSLECQHISYQLKMIIMATSPHGLSNTLRHSDRLEVALSQPSTSVLHKKTMPPFPSSSHSIFHKDLHLSTSSRSSFLFVKVVSRVSETGLLIRNLELELRKKQPSRSRTRGKQTLTGLREKQRVMAYIEYRSDPTSRVPAGWKMIHPPILPRPLVMIAMSYP